MGKITLDTEKILKDAKPSKTFNQVQREVMKEQVNEDYPFPIGHKYWLKRARAWNNLANKVVGY